MEGILRERGVAKGIGFELAARGAEGGSRGGGRGVGFLFGSFLFHGRTFYRGVSEKSGGKGVVGVVWRVVV